MWFVAPAKNARPSGSSTPAPISLEAISTRPTGTVPASTQVLEAATYFSARLLLLHRTVTTVSSGKSTQLSSEELDPLVGPAVQLSATGS